jgi:hypothetical protein
MELFKFLVYQGGPIGFAVVIANCQRSAIEAITNHIQHSVNLVDDTTPFGEVQELVYNGNPTLYLCKRCGGEWAILAEQPEVVVFPNFERQDDTERVPACNGCDR